MAQRPVAAGCGAAPAPQCLLEAALAEAVNAKRPYKRFNIMAEIGGAYAKIGRRDDSYRVFEKTITSLANNDDLRYVVRAMADAGEFKDALGIAQDIPSAETRDWELRELAKKQARAGDPEFADAIAQGILKPQGRAFALIDIANIQIKAGDGVTAVWPRLNKALELANEVPKGDWIVTGVIATLAKAGDLKRAEGLALHLSDPYQIDIAAMEIETARAKAGGLAAAVTRAGKMNQAHNLAILLADLAAIAATTGDPAKAEALFQEAFSRADKIRDYIAYGKVMAEIVYSREETGDLDGALTTVGKIDNPKLRDALLDHLLRTRIAAGTFAGLDRILPAMTDPSSIQMALVAISSGLVEAGDTAEARRSLSTARKAIDKSGPGRTRDEAYGELAANWAKLGEFEKAAGIADIIENGYQRNAAWASIAAAKAKPGDAAAAIKIAARIDQPYWRAVALKDIALVLAGRD